MSRSVLWGLLKLHTRTLHSSPAATHDFLHKQTSWSALIDMMQEVHVHNMSERAMHMFYNQACVGVNHPLPRPGVIFYVLQAMYSPSYN